MLEKVGVVIGVHVFEGVTVIGSLCIDSTSKYKEAYTDNPTSHYITRSIKLRVELLRNNNNNNNKTTELYEKERCSPPQ